MGKRIVKSLIVGIMMAMMGLYPAPLRAAVTVTTDGIYDSSDSRISSLENDDIYQEQYEFRGKVAPGTPERVVGAPGMRAYFVPVGNPNFGDDFSNLSSLPWVDMTFKETTGTGGGGGVPVLHAAGEETTGNGIWIENRIVSSQLLGYFYGNHNVHIKGKEPDEESDGAYLDLFGRVDCHTFDDGGDGSVRYHPDKPSIVHEGAGDRPVEELRDPPLPTFPAFNPPFSTALSYYSGHSRKVDIPTSPAGTLNTTLDLTTLAIANGLDPSQGVIAYYDGNLTIGDDAIIKGRGAIVANGRITLSSKARLQSFIPDSLAPHAPDTPCIPLSFWANNGFEMTYSGQPGSKGPAWLLQGAVFVKADGVTINYNANSNIWVTIDADIWAEAGEILFKRTSTSGEGNVNLNGLLYANSNRVRLDDMTRLVLNNGKGSLSGIVAKNGTSGLSLEVNTYLETNAPIYSDMASGSGDLDLILGSTGESLINAPIYNYNTGYNINFNEVPGATAAKHIINDKIYSKADIKLSCNKIQLGPNSWLYAQGKVRGPTSGFTRGLLLGGKIYACSTAETDTTGTQVGAVHLKSLGGLSLRVRKDDGPPITGGIQGHTVFIWARGDIGLWDATGNGSFFGNAVGKGIVVDGFRVIVDHRYASIFSGNGTVEIEGAGTDPSVYKLLGDTYAWETTKFWGPLTIDKTSRVLDDAPHEIQEGGDRHQDANIWWGDAADSKRDKIIVDTKKENGIDVSDGVFNIPYPYVYEYPFVPMPVVRLDALHFLPDGTDHSDLNTTFDVNNHPIIPAWTPTYSTNWSDYTNAPGAVALAATISGNLNMTDRIYYRDGDLTIQTGATISGTGTLAVQGRLIIEEGVTFSYTPCTANRPADKSKWPAIFIDGDTGDRDAGLWIEGVSSGSTLTINGDIHCHQAAFPANTYESNYLGNGFDGSGFSLIADVKGKLVINGDLRFLRDSAGGNDRMRTHVVFGGKDRNQGEVVINGLFYNNNKRARATKTCIATNKFEINGPGFVNTKQLFLGYVETNPLSSNTKVESPSGLGETTGWIKMNAPIYQGDNDKSPMAINAAHSCRVDLRDLYCFRSNPSIFDGDIHLAGVMAIRQPASASGWRILIKTKFTQDEITSKIVSQGDIVFEGLPDSEGIILRGDVHTYRTGSVTNPDLAFKQGNYSLTMDRVRLVVGGQLWFGAKEGGKPESECLGGQVRITNSQVIDGCKMTGQFKDLEVTDSLIVNDTEDLLFYHASGTAGNPSILKFTNSRIGSAQNIHLGTGRNFRNYTKTELNKCQVFRLKHGTTWIHVKAADLVKIANCWLWSSESIAIGGDNDPNRDPTEYPRDLQVSETAVWAGSGIFLNSCDEISVTGADIKTNGFIEMLTSNPLTAEVSEFEGSAIACKHIWVCGMKEIVRSGGGGGTDDPGSDTFRGRMAPLDSTRNGLSWDNNRWKAYDTASGTLAPDPSDTWTVTDRNNFIKMYSAGRYQSWDRQFVRFNEGDTAAVGGTQYLFHSQDDATYFSLAGAGQIYDSDLQNGGPRDLVIRTRAAFNDLDLARLRWAIRYDSADPIPNFQDGPNSDAADGNAWGTSGADDALYRYDYWRTNFPALPWVDANGSSPDGSAEVRYNFTLTDGPENAYLYTGDLSQPGGNPTKTQSAPANEWGQSFSINVQDDDTSQPTITNAQLTSSPVLWNPVTSSTIPITVEADITAGGANPISDDNFVVRIQFSTDSGFSSLIGDLQYEYDYNTGTSTVTSPVHSGSVSVTGTEPNGTYKFTLNGGYSIAGASAVYWRIITDDRDDEGTATTPYANYSSWDDALTAIFPASISGRRGVRIISIAEPDEGGDRLKVEAIVDIDIWNRVTIRSWKRF